MRAGSCHHEPQDGLGVKEKWVEAGSWLKYCILQCQHNTEHWSNLRGEQQQNIGEQHSVYAHVRTHIFLGM